MRKVLLLLVFVGAVVFAQDDQYSNKNLKRAKDVPKTKSAEKQSNGILYTTVASVEAGQVTTVSGHVFSPTKENLAKYAVNGLVELRLKNGKVVAFAAKDGPR